MSTSPLEPGDRPPAPNPTPNGDPVQDCRRFLGRAAREIDLALDALAHEDHSKLSWPIVHRSVVAAANYVENAEFITRLLIALTDDADDEVDTAIIDKECKPTAEGAGPMASKGGA